MMIKHQYDVESSFGAQSRIAIDIRCSQRGRSPLSNGAKTDRNHDGQDNGVPAIVPASSFSQTPHRKVRRKARPVRAAD
jgi:hypothetical protein